MTTKRSKTIKVLHILMGAERLIGGCEIYRTTMPMHYLQKQSVGGWYTAWIFMDTFLSEWKLYGVEMIRDLLCYDIVVFPRTVIPGSRPDALQGLAALIFTLREAGVKVVYEVDDDYTNEFRKVADGDSITPMQWADAVTVTTPYLSERLRKFTNQPIHVLPNCIDPAVWRDAPMRTERTQADAVVIGLTGSATHVEDWRVLTTVMPEVLEKHPNAYFIVMGYHPPYLANLARTEYLPGANYEDYSQIIRACDIILAPVDPQDQFNNGKSPIKAIEGMSAQRLLSGGRSAGAAVIATSNPVYQLAVKHNETGLLVEHTPQGWSLALDRLIADSALRERLQIAGFKSAYKHRDISKEYAQWARAYRKVLLSPPNPVRIPLAIEGHPHGN